MSWPVHPWAGSFDFPTAPTTALPLDATQGQAAKLSRVVNKVPKATQGQNATLGTQYIPIAGSRALGITGDLTLECWFKPASIGVYQALIFRGSNAIAGPYRLGITAAGKLVFARGNGTAEATLTGATTLVAGTTYLLQATMSGNVAQVWVNGASDGSGTLSTSISDTGNPVELGRDLTGNYAAGVLDEAAVYATALSSTRISTHRTAGITTLNNEYGNVTARVSDQAAMTTERGMDQVRPLATIMAGKSDLQLDNRSRDYSAENASSALFAYLRGGHQIRFNAFDPSTVKYLPQWQGVMQDMPQNPSFGQRTVSIASLGNQSLLKKQPTATANQQGISTALYQNITSDQALGYLCDALGIPARLRNFQTGLTTFLWWWMNNEDPQQAVQAIINSEGPGARLYEDEWGRLTFENRHNRVLAARSITSQATFSATGNFPLFSDAGFSYTKPRENIVNICTVTAVKRSVKAAAQVWSSTESFTLQANDSITRVATASEPFTGAVTPVAGTDFTVSAGSIASVTLDRTSGQNVSITYTAGASGCTFSNPQLRAQPVSQDASFDLINSIDTSTSKDTWGAAIYPLEVRQDIDPSELQDFCDTVVLWWQNPRARCVIEVDGAADDANLTQVLNRKPSDRVTVVEPQTGVDGDFFVELVDLEMDVPGKRVIGTLSLETVGTLGRPFQLNISDLNNAEYVLWV
ncbi:MAG: LamG domain-containing protein [Patescibacteria group bacterium]|nr:LamG domain-containing protein [Patescibacteria group bacterium]